MATADLPKEFDVIVLGTGMPESIVAAAFSRIGQAVLHLDRNEHYSGDWASFSLKGIEQWAELHRDAAQDFRGLDRPSVDEASLLEEGETLIELPLNKTNFSQVEIKYHVVEEDEIDRQAEKDAESAKLVSQSAAQQSSSISAPPIGTSIVSGESSAVGDLDTCNTKCEKDSNKLAEDKNQVTGSDATEREMDGIECEMSAVNVSVSDKTRQENKETEDASVETTKGDDEDNGSVSNKAGLVGEEATAVGEKAVPEKNTVESKDNGSKTVDNKADVQEQSSGDTSDRKDKMTWTVKRLKAQWRKFNLDLSPKVLYSVGDMVELLISSDIAKYCEFKTVTQVLTVIDGKLERVPCSRADVFSSKKVTMLEKRMLMKFLQFCLQFEDQPEEIGDFLEKPFSEFLTSKKLTPTIKHYIQHSIAMATDSMTTKEGLEKMKKFLRSLGRYGNTAFLWSLYGSGELPQAFCRMCAVFGGIYCLRTSAASLVIGQDRKCSGIVTTDGQKIKCKWLIMEGSYAPESFISEYSVKNIVSRGIIFTDRLLLTVDEQEQLSLMNLPCPDDGERPVSVLELPSSSMAIPAGLYAYHLTRKGKAYVKPEDDLDYAVSTLFSYEGNLDDTKPAVVWSMFFIQHDMSEIQPGTDIPDNVILMKGPGVEIDIDTPVQEAREIFKRVLPEEEFLPKAPNPEDIIYVDDAEAQVADGSSQPEFSETDKSETDQSEGKTGTDRSEGKVETDQSGGKSEADHSEIKVETDEADTNQSEISKENQSKSTS